MKAALERLREIRTGQDREDDPLLAKYLPDGLGDPCPDCGSKEKWRWHHGRLLCRACLIRGEPSPQAGEGQEITVSEDPVRRRPWW
jgi:hypothetical protein